MLTDDEAFVAKGVPRVHAGLLRRLDAIATRFDHRPIYVVSGSRPNSKGSLHQLSRAVDIFVEGVKNEELFAFCKTLDDTGCGYYPNSVFVHVDVRPPGTGHVSWVDISRPGEQPRYVSTWPLPKSASEPAAQAPVDGDDHGAAN